MIKAYHQVGGDDRLPAERKAYLKQILDLGEIVPAIQRIQRREMYNECFTDFTEESQGSNSVDELLSLGSSPEAREALTLMAREKIALLPEVGSTHTMFNCLDLVAGDFERVFLSARDWYSYPSGFVFDAEELLMAGAWYRPRDLLGHYNHAVEEAVKFTYDSVEDARRELESALAGVLEAHESTGEEAVTLLRLDSNKIARALRIDCTSKGCPSEIVWPGSLPLGLAIEMWSEGRRTKFPKGVER
jgi:hypothetical protein